MTIKLKDISLMHLDAQRIEAIAAIFTEGEGTKQQAFDLLVEYSAEVLMPFTEEKKSGLKLLPRALKKLGKLMEETLLDDLGLTSSYCAPARQMARAIIEGCSPNLRFVIDNLKATGDTEAGDLPGPMFAPARLIVSMKSLRLDAEKSPFEVDESGDEDVLMLKDRNGTLHRFASLSIEGIKDALHTSAADPTTLKLINNLIGVFTGEGEKEQPGTLGREVAKLAKAANAGEEPDTRALAICETLTEAIETSREAVVRWNREERAAAEALADMKRAQARLERQQNLGVERENLPASTVNSDGQASTTAVKVSKPKTKK